MKILSILIFGITLNALAQEPFPPNETVVNLIELGKKLKEADSIVVLSHINIFELEKYDKKGNHYLPKPIVYRNKVNKELVKERIRLTEKQRDSLSIIMTRIPEKRITVDALCSYQQHTILIYKKRKIDFVDICFECIEANFSKDLKLDEYYSFDPKKWKLLLSFFLETGLTYKLLEDDILWFFNDD